MSTINKNLTLYKKPLYQGLPVYLGEHGSIEEYLAKCKSILDEAREEYSKVFVVRVDLRFPKYFDLEYMNQSNTFIDNFIKNLKGNLDTKAAISLDAGRRVHPCRIRYIWVREQADDNDHWHYHLALVLNGNAYCSIGRYKDGRGDNLAGRIQEAWEKVLGINFSVNNGLVHFTRHYQINSDDGNIAEAFYQLSYLCKAETKRYGNGYHVFGSSNKLRPT